MPSSRSSSRIKVSQHRARLRAQGLRALQLWVPDTRAAKFRDEARRQSIRIAASPHETEDQAFIDAASHDAW